MRNMFAAFAILLAALFVPAAAQPAGEAAQLAPQTGVVAIPEAGAALSLSGDYVFYGRQDARHILFDMWGNPPDQAEQVLGLVMPAGATLTADGPQSAGWGAVVTFEAIGHVTADDARNADYPALLAQLQAAAAQANAQRRADGFQGVDVIGWAAEPRYDAVSHAVIWGRELAFDGEDDHRLNLDLRILGRAGVLSVNFVASMTDLPQIRAAADELAGQITFNPGERYEDFDSQIDPSAGYGIAGLVAGGAGLAVAQKAGLAALLLGFLKPALAVLAVMLIAAAARFRHMFGFGKNEVLETEADPELPSDAPPTPAQDGPIEGSSFPPAQREASPAPDPSTGSG